MHPMKPKLLLRTAAVIMFLHLSGHMVGAATWKNNPDPSIQEVIKGMAGHQFIFMGANQSLSGHHDGYGIASALALLFFSVVFWIASSADHQTKAMSIKIVTAISVILFLWGVDEFVFFFPFAAAFTFLSCALGFYSLRLLKKQ
jgi:hypothetical protein